MRNHITYFTVCNIAYFHKALVLADSIKQYENRKLKIFLFDEKRTLPDYSDIAEIVWIQDFSINFLHELAFKYDVTEFTTSLKPYITIELLKDYDKVVFFDPDILICSNLDIVTELLDNNDIILTPHYTVPQKRGVDLSVSDLNMMRFGSFNLGFFAVKKADESQRFLSWWNERCLDLCFFEPQFGISTDQKWVSIAPCFFKNMHISFNLGLNVAFWNLHERTISIEDSDDFYVNNSYKLIFFHFSSFNDEEPEKLTKRPLFFKIDQNDALQKLISIYKRKCQKFSISLKDVEKKYSFDYMEDGSYISPTLRRAFANNIDKFSSEQNPFQVNSDVYKFAKRNDLIMKRSKYYTPKGLSDIKKYKTVFKIINIVLKIILKILNPVRFANLSRLLVYLSSYRQIEGLWKK